MKLPYSNKKKWICLSIYDFEKDVSVSYGPNSGKLIRNCWFALIPVPCGDNKGSGSIAASVMVVVISLAWGDFKGLCTEFTHIICVIPFYKSFESLEFLSYFPPSFSVFRSKNLTDNWSVRQYLFGKNLWMQTSTQSVNKTDGFFLARNANARRHLMWESEQNSV